MLPVLELEVKLKNEKEVVGSEVCIVVDSEDWVSDVMLELEVLEELEKEDIEIPVVCELEEFAILGILPILFVPGIN